MLMLTESTKLVGNLCYIHQPHCAVRVQFLAANIQSFAAIPDISSARNQPHCRPAAAYSPLSGDILPMQGGDIGGKSYAVVH
jgi:hypothetical protein